MTTSLPLCSPCTQVIGSIKQTAPEFSFQLPLHRPVVACVVLLLEQRRCSHMHMYMHVVESSPKNELIGIVEWQHLASSQTS